MTFTRAGPLPSAMRSTPAACPTITSPWSSRRPAGRDRGAGIHLLFVTLLPPGRRDPRGVRPVLWGPLGGGEPFAPPADKPLTLASYAVGDEIVAYLESVAVGDALLDMPVFLTPERHV